MAPFETIPQYFLDAVRRYGVTPDLIGGGRRARPKVAFRQKRLGLWQETTWADSYDQVRAIALGLLGLGLRRGDRVALIGDNDREVIWADLGVLCAGGVVVGIVPDAAAKEIQY
ncbi:MAG: AMP-binding protein [Chloroflexi bacterium]|nr:AMP-binding protein [Chloroflexota bacterium]MBI3734762.1 AMP-binding protein [Chloroflexota bacterium]